MKKITVIICSMIIAMTVSCGSKVNYLSLNESKELKMPFEKKDFEDSDDVFYSIQSTRGAGAKSAITKMNTLKAKTDLIAKVNSYISNKVTNESQGSDNKSFSNRFKSISESSVSSVVNRLKLLEEKWFIVGKSSSGKEEFEVWQVYSLALNNVESALASKEE